MRKDIVFFITFVVEFFRKENVMEKIHGYIVAVYIMLVGFADVYGSTSLVLPQTVNNSNQVTVVPQLNKLNNKPLLPLTNYRLKNPYTVKNVPPVSKKLIASLKYPQQYPTRKIQTNTQSTGNGKNPLSISKTSLNFAEQAAIAQQKEMTKKQTIIDTMALTQSYPIQSMQNGKTVRYNNNMNAPLPDYIKASEAKYTNLAREIPEFFTTYLAEFFLTKQHVVRPFTPDEINEKSYNWEINKNQYSINNLSQGMKLLNTMLDPKYKDPLTDTSFTIYKGTDQLKGMKEPFSDFVAVLKNKFPHVPVKILEIYATELINTQYKPTATANTLGRLVVGALKNATSIVFGANTVSDVPQPLTIDTEALKLEINNLQFPTKPDPNNTDKQIFDALQLSTLQKLYLTITAIEDVNVKNAQFLVSTIESKEPVSTSTLQQVGQEAASPELLLLRAGITKNDTNNIEKKAIDAKLAENYPSYKNFMDNKQTIEYFKQMESDSLRLAKDIDALELLENTKNYSSGQTLNKAKVLISAKELLQKMDKEIQEKRMQHFKDTFLPSKNVDINESYKAIEKFVTETVLKNDTNAVKIFNDHVNSAADNMRQFVRDIETKRENLITAANTTLDLNKLDSMLEEEQRLYINNALTKAQEDQKKRYITSSDQVLLQEVVEQLQREKAVLDTKVEIAQQAAQEKYDILVALAKKNNAKNYEQELIPDMLESLLIDLQAIPNNTSVTDFIKYSKNLLKEIKGNEIFFENIDLKDIEKKLNTIIKANENIEPLRLYFRVFEKINKVIEPVQEKLKLHNGVSTRAQNFAASLLAQKTVKGKNALVAIENVIQEIDEKITELKTRKNENSNVTMLQVDVDYFNGILSNSPITASIKVSEVIDLYNEVKKVLLQKEATEKAKTAVQKMKELFGKVPGKAASGDMYGAFGDFLRAAANVPSAAGETFASNFERYFEPIRDKLSHRALAAIATVVAAISGPLIAILSNKNLTDDEKKEMTDDLFSAGGADIANIVTADLTGSDVSAVATGDATSIVVSGVSNNIVKTLAPEDSSTSSYQGMPKNSDSYMNNLEQFKARYSSILDNPATSPSQPKSTNSYTNPYNQHTHAPSSTSTKNLPVTSTSSYKPYIPPTTQNLLPTNKTASSDYSNISSLVGSATTQPTVTTTPTNSYNQYSYSPSDSSTSYTAPSTSVKQSYPSYEDLLNMNF